MCRSKIKEMRIMKEKGANNAAKQAEGWKQGGRETEKDRTRNK